VPFIGLIKNFNNFDYFSQKSRKLPIPAMVKIRQTFKFISVQDIDTNFACIVGFSGSAISNMLPENFKGAKGVAMATKFNKKRAKIEQNILSRSHRSS